MNQFILLAAIGLLAPAALPAAEWPENDQVKVIEAAKADCYVYQADCLRITVMCKKFLPVGRPILEVAWLDPGGAAFYTVVKHIGGTAHCNKGDLIHRFAPFYEGKQFVITLR